MKKLTLKEQKLTLKLQTKWNDVYENDEIIAVVNRTSGHVKIKPRVSQHMRIDED